SPTYSLTFLLNATAPPDIYTLSLHDALPIWRMRADPRSDESADQDDDADDEAPREPSAPREHRVLRRQIRGQHDHEHDDEHVRQDRKSTRLNSSHLGISYAVFCLKKKTKKRE